MITAKLKMKGNKNNNQLQRIRDSVKKLNGKSTEVGYFKSQGMHLGADKTPDYSYTALAQALEIGYFPMMKGRDTIADAFRTPMPFMKNIVELALKGKKKSPIFNRPFKKWSGSLDKNVEPDILLDAIGKLSVFSSLKVFNNKAFFPQAPENMTPLVETGELMRKYAYRTKTNKKVRRN